MKSLKRALVWLRLANRQLGKHKHLMDAARLLLTGWEVFKHLL